MTPQEYEQKFAEALDHIGRTHVVKIQTLHSGRATQIDGKWCSDEAVFRRAWGVDAARAIIEQKPTAY